MGVAVRVEHVDLGAHLLDPLFVAHAKALLLVDDQQAQVLECDIAAKQTVRADDQVDRSGSQAFRGRRSCSERVRKRESMLHVHRESGFRRSAEGW